MHVTISNRNAARLQDAIPSSGTVSAGVNLAGFPILGLLVPVCTAATITIEITIDGTNWYALKKSDGSTAGVSITGGATAFFVGSDELTQLAAYAGQLLDVTAANQIKVRLKSSVAQGSQRTFTWLGLG